jgi:chromosome segregation ATPase
MLETLISAAVGAATAGIPLYFKFRSAIAAIRKKEHEQALEIQQKSEELNIQLQTKKNEQSKLHKIDTEAEWKRIIEARNEELASLRVRDDNQEKQILDLYNKHLKCEVDKARTEANYEAMKATVLEVKEELTKLRDIIRGYQNAIPQGTAAPSGSTTVAVFHQDGHGQGSPGPSGV